MKQSEFDFDYQKQLEKLDKNIVKFAKKFNLVICDTDTPENRYKLLKRDFKNVYSSLNFEEEWKKVSYEHDEKLPEKRIGIKDRYKQISETDAFKKAYVDRDIGETLEIKEDL